MLTCNQCGKEDNRLKANYCKSCGKGFTDKERDDAYAQTVYGKYEKFQETKSWLTLSKITGNRFVRIAFLLLLGFLVFLNVRSGGTGLALRNGDGYSLAYSRESDEYYVLSELDSVSLSVRLPQKAASCVLESYVNGELIRTQPLTKDAAVSVPRTSDGYYVLRASLENGSVEELLFFVCEEVRS